MRKRERDQESERPREGQTKCASQCPHPVVGLPEGAAVGFCPRLAIHGLGMRGREPVVTAWTVHVCVCVWVVRIGWEGARGGRRRLRIRELELQSEGGGGERAASFVGFSSAAPAISSALFCLGSACRLQLRPATLCPASQWATGRSLQRRGGSLMQGSPLSPSNHKLRPTLSLALSHRALSWASFAARPPIYPFAPLCFDHIRQCQAHMPSWTVQEFGLLHFIPTLFMSSWHSPPHQTSFVGPSLSHAAGWGDSIARALAGASTGCGEGPPWPPM